MCTATLLLTLDVWNRSIKTCTPEMGIRMALIFSYPSYISGHFRCRLMSQEYPYYYGGVNFTNCLSDSDCILIVNVVYVVTIGDHSCKSKQPFHKLMLETCLNGMNRNRYIIAAVVLLLLVFFMYYFHSDFSY